MIVRGSRSLRNSAPIWKSPPPSADDGKLMSADRAGSAPQFEHEDKKLPRSQPLGRQTEPLMVKSTFLLPDKWNTAAVCRCGCARWGKETCCLRLLALASVLASFIMKLC